MNKKEALQKRFNKLEKHYIVLKEYKVLIDNLLIDIAISGVFCKKVS